MILKVFYTMSLLTEEVSSNSVLLDAHAAALKPSQAVVKLAAPRRTSVMAAAAATKNAGFAVE